MTQIILIFIILLVFSRPHQFHNKKFWNLFWLNTSPNPSWVQHSNWFLSKTTQTRLILIFHIILALSRPQNFWDISLEFFWLSSFPYSSWVQRTNRFLSKTTQTWLILILIIFWAISRPHQLFTTNQPSNQCSSTMGFKIDGHLQSFRMAGEADRRRQMNSVSLKWTAFAVHNEKMVPVNTSNNRMFSYKLL
jgi:hypothetical protein